MVRLSEEEYNRIMKAREPKPPLREKERVIAQPKFKETKMNKTEARYLQDIIMPDVFSGIIKRWRFDEVRFRLGDNCFYKPDFLVVYLTSIEIHEVKGGFIRDDALVKFKASAERFDFFLWKMIQWKGGKWTILHNL